MRRTRRETRPRIDIVSRRHLSYWTARWGVTAEELKSAVARVGTLPWRVAEALGRGSAPGRRS